MTLPKHPSSHPPPSTSFLLLLVMLVRLLPLPLILALFLVLIIAIVPILDYFYLLLTSLPPPHPLPSPTFFQLLFPLVLVLVLHFFSRYNFPSSSPASSRPHSSMARLTNTKFSTPNSDFLSFSPWPPPSPFRSPQRSLPLPLLCSCVSVFDQNCSLHKYLHIQHPLKRKRSAALR